MISYPVSKDKRFDVYDKTFGGFRKKNIPWLRADGMQLKNLPLNIVWLERIHTHDPFDSATEKLGQPAPSIDLANETVTYHRPAIALTQEEIDARTEKAEDNLRRDQLRTIARKFKDGTATDQQVQKAIYWLFKEIGGL